MEELIIQTTEKNAVVRDWSLKTQKEKGDSLMEGCVSNLPEHITMNVHQNNLEDLVRIWNQWDLDTRGIFTERYGDVANLIAINVDEQLIQAMKVERTPFHMFSKTFTPLEAYLEKEWPKEVTKQHWVSVFQNLRAEDVTWRAPWIHPSILLYKVGNQDWVPLLGLWGGVGYAPLMVQR
ncbi:hypothetical protein CXB51_013647 [Gossypium anomalum]|uniref:DUF7745 domain-containing protein n=1 Tax=Gossypium anomalum TaxID=47600 RepID=A0A8J5Z8I1_9ROSI|nr:hypothetical protein CXB51_013647 [Gossypium anomalum]